MPKWLFLLLGAISLVIMLIRISYSIRVLAAKRSIFGSNKQNMGLEFASHIGYALVALMLSIYFIILYIDNAYSTIVLEITLILLLLVLIIETAAKRKLKK